MCFTAVFRAFHLSLTRPPTGITVLEDGSKVISVMATSQKGERVQMTFTESKVYIVCAHALTNECSPNPQIVNFNFFFWIFFVCKRVHTPLALPGDW